MMKGIDISQWQETVDFKKVKSQIDFAILREGYRKTIDPRFLEYVKGCRDNGIPIHGVYHFSYATTKAEAKEEAKACIANIQKAGLGKETIVFYDFEYDTVKKAKKKGITLGRDECVPFTNTFCDYVKGQGYRTGVYANLDYYKTMYNKATIDKYIFWLADYSGDPDLPCAYHQYTDSGKIAGINGKVDMNYYYGEGSEDKTMTVRMSNCGHDERSKYSGGQAGDQTGNEWYLREWYAYPWNYVIRWKDQTLGDLCADLAIEAAENQLIGYDQNQRDTFWTHLKASNYRPSQITIACEADCSSGTIAIIKAVGYLKGIPELQKCSATYTGNMLEWFQGAGKKYFEVLTGKYLTSPSLARRGDINLNTVHHVNITVDNGADADKGSSLTESSGKAAETLIGQAQTYLNNFAGTGLEVDGEVGPKTKKAFRKAIQGALNLDAGSVILDVDGEIGAKTKTALKKIVLKKGSTGNLVTVLEIGMLLHNINPGGVECPGEFGSGLLKAVKAYQKQAGLTVDGEAGYKTFMKLQK